MGAREWKDLIGNYSISRAEVANLLILGIFFALIASFDKWGSTAFSFEEGLSNLLMSFIVVLICVSVHDFAHRFVALRRRIRPKLVINYYWLFFSVLMVFLSRGTMKLFFGESITLEAMEAHRLGYGVHRLGRFTYRMGNDDLSAVAVAGPIGSIALAAISRSLSMALGGSPFFDAMAGFSVWYAILNFLPLPSLDGLLYFFYSRKVYAFVFGSIVGYFIWSGVAQVSVWGSFVLALITGAATCYMFYIFWESS